VYVFYDASLTCVRSCPDLTTISRAINSHAFPRLVCFGSYENNQITMSRGYGVGQYWIRILFYSESEETWRNHMERGSMYV